tara:strand:- start:1519 stop:1863 length:345 start_codon:yes stop_codon:yes gene_type:complete
MKFYIRKFVLFLYLVIIFLVSLIPSQSVQSIHMLGFDKLFHLVEYFILGFIFKYSIKHSIGYYGFLILSVPILDEFFVQRISGRSVDPWDFLFNIIGLILGYKIKGYFDKRTKY